MAHTVKNSVPTWNATIAMAGSSFLAGETLRRFCMRGFCATLTKTSFVYTGGREEGFLVGVINYPRFPSTPAALKKITRDLARTLAHDCCQNSFSIIFPMTTEWYSNGREK